jgi:hypothetical protein
MSEKAIRLFIYLHNCVIELSLFLFNMKIHIERPFEESSQDRYRLFTHKQVARG